MKSLIDSDEKAQIHVLEMLTLFWLFFMSAIFVLRIDVPDPPSAATDATLELSGEDAIRMARAELPLNSSAADSLLVEHLADRNLDSACDLILDGLGATVDGRCWLAMDGSASEVHGGSTSPLGRTETVHAMLQQ
ncbi:MAG: hypothetical protein QF707_05295, partial [Candidatus Poseidoniaceae archaeon]|nr:hypothetical protein [Candidatus Poseidoniaceae archaeon]